MSGQASGWVLNHGPHPDHVGADGRRYGTRARGLRLVLLAVADSANINGEHSHPGFDNVARCALYSRRQAITLLAQLVEDGWLEVEKQGGGAGLATVYRLPRMAKEKGATAALKSEEGCNLEEKRVQYDPETVQSRLHPNGISNVTTQPGAAARNAAGADLPGTDDEEAGGVALSSEVVAPLIAGAREALGPLVAAQAQARADEESR